jgi:SAM-dependent methyltransferase
MRRSSATAAAATTWNRNAGRYGAQGHWETTAVDAALRVAAPRSGERLVDLATGSGLVLRRLAGRPDRPREVVGVDRSPRMLAGVGELPPGWSTITADARSVPLPDGWADVVTCAYMLHLLDPPARAAVLAEARRLLAPRTSSRLVVVTVWAGTPFVRGGLGLLARTLPRAWGGLRPLDPSADLVAAGLAVTQRVVLARSGYPSLVLGAEARPGDLLA